jgi:hypothetical protein
MAKTKSTHWCEAEADEFADVGLAEAERAYRSESGDKPWARGFIERFEAWLERSAGAGFAPQA